jgi:hypothetical protein
MTKKRKASYSEWLARWFGRRPSVPPELQRARELLAAIDAGGLPLNPAIVNRIARDLGLEVARGASVEETMGRIRAAVGRAASAASGGDGLR